MPDGTLLLAFVAASLVVLLMPGPGVLYVVGARGTVERFEIDHLSGLNFVMDKALEGGVNESLNLDAHGKSWSFLLLALTIDLDD